MMIFPRVAQRRTIAAALAISSCFALAAFARAAEVARNPHQEALSALSDIDAAIAALSSASSVTANSAGPYKQQAQRATDALAGFGSHSSPGEAGDRAGAIGHLSWLSAHAGDNVWGPAVQGALVNLKVAEAHLSDSAKANGMEEFWSETSEALQSLLIAAGRPSQPGVLGGLRGALASTDLGVPPGSKVVDGCAAPDHVAGQSPAYGATKGYLTYVTIPRDHGTTRLPETFGVRDISVRGNAIILHTAAVDMVGYKLCLDAEAATMTPASPNPSKSDVAALYTEQQAEQGKGVFDSKCSSCHGSNLQGSASGPPIGGSAFLKKAKMLDWKVADMRNMVVSAMPANNPGSLSPDQYADVLAYLLAVNCYPPGSTPFPANDTSVLKQTTLHQIQGAKGENPKDATCPVKG